MKLLALLTMIAVLSGGAYAYELNSLNTIQYSQGQTIEIETKILDTDAYAVTDAACSAYVTKDSDNSIILDTVNLTYNPDEEHFDYYWVPELTWWEDIEQIWNPAIGNYHAYVLCTGGELGSRILVDVIAIQVVD